MIRICITGGPRTGKTTHALHLADEMNQGPTFPGVGVRHTDDLIAKLAHLGKESWSAASAVVVDWLSEPGPWIIEGVAVSRALRKWRDAHPGERPPVDRVIYLREPYAALTAGQAAMAKGVTTVHEGDVEPWLRQHGIRTEYPSTPKVAHQVQRPSPDEA